MEVVFNVVLVRLIMGKYKLAWNLKSLIDTLNALRQIRMSGRIFLNALAEWAFGCFVPFVEVVAGLYPW